MSDCIISVGAYDGILHQIASAVRALAAVSITTPGWGRSILLLPEAGLLRDEIPQTLQVTSCPCRVTMPGELIRLDFQRPDRIAASYEDVRALLVQEIEPFIIGVGQVRARNTPEGIVILRINEWLEKDGH